MKNSGFTMLELLIALLIISIGLLALSQLQLINWQAINQLSMQYAMPV